MNKKLEVFFGKPQTTAGVAVDLVAADFLEVTSDSDLSMIFENESVENCSASFSSEPAVIGAVRSECQLDFNMRSFGATTVPDWAKMLTCAAFDITTTDVGGSNKYTLNPVMTSKDATVWRYNGLEVVKLQNLMFDWSISGELNKKCLLSLKGKGCLNALPDIGVCPTITKNGSPTPAILPVTKVIFGSGLYSPLKFSFEGGVVVEQRVTGSDFGYGLSEVTDRKIKFSCTLYKDLPNVISPYTAMRNQSETELSFEFGKAGRKIKLITNHANISDIKEGTSGGNTQTWDISGTCNSDDFSIIVNSDLS